MQFSSYFPIPLQNSLLRNQDICFFSPFYGHDYYVLSFISAAEEMHFDEKHVFNWVSQSELVSKNL